MPVVYGYIRILSKGVALGLIAPIWLQMGWSWWLPMALFFFFLLVSSPATVGAVLLATCAQLVLQANGAGLALWGSISPATVVFILTLLFSLPCIGRLPGMGGGLLSGEAIAPQWAARGRAVCALVVAGALLAPALKSVSPAASLSLGGMYLLLWRRLGAFAPPRNAPSAGSMRNTLTLLILSLAFSLLVLEGGARILFPNTVMSGVYQPSPKYIFLLRPGGVGNNTVALSDGGKRHIPLVISEQGIRDNLVPPKEEGEFRVVMLGDSFTMGHAVEGKDSIPRLLEKRLRSAMPDAKIRVINGGIGGAGVLQELGMLRERVLPLDPDLVILQLFLNNDVDNALQVTGKRQRAYLAEWHSTLRDYHFGNLPQVRAERWMLRNVRAYQAFRGATKKPWIRNTLESLRFFKPLREKPVPSENRPDTMEVNLAEWYPELEEGLGIMKGHILQMRKECRERGVDFMTYCIPLREEVSDASWEELTGYYPSVDYERMKGLRRMDALLDEEGIPRASVVEALRDAGAEGETYFALDGHLTEFGNDVVARVWAEYLMGGYLRERLAGTAR